MIEEGYINLLYEHASYPVAITDAEGAIVFQNAFFRSVHSINANGKLLTIDSFIHCMRQPETAREVLLDNVYFRFTTTNFSNYFLITGTNVQDLFEERNFYKDTLNNLPADIGVFDTSGKYLYVNPEGIKDESLRQWIIGKDDFDYCRYRNKDTAMAEYRSSLYRSIIQNKQEQGFEEEINKPGQEPDWQMRKIKPVFDEHGEVKFLIGYGINIKERKKAELAQKEALELIERSAKAKEEFVAVMSHEIRTPMNAIIGMSRLLAKTTLNKKQSEYLDAVLTASGNLIVIVNDILDFSKIEAGKLRLEYSGFSFTEVVEYAKAVTAQQAAEKGIQLVFDIDPKLSEIFIGDVYRINQVVVNLLNNAIKFTHQGKVSTHIRLEEDGSSDQQVCICVKDSGIGMTQDFMQHMFSMYSQEEGVTRKYGGTGLGLKITSQLVEMMNGRIEVESKKNEGSCIKVKLNLTKGSIKDVHPHLPVSYHENALRGKKILIAEDNSLNVLVASTVLQNHGATVVTAENGEMALSVLREQPDINAVLMDVEMPVMDGIEATHILRNEMLLSIPVIALTANVMPEDKEKLFLAGMTEFIAKPFSETELLGVLLKHL